jgi:hypothetical protein
MARGGHGLPEVSLGPAMLNPSMPRWRAIPETALWPFQGWPARKARDQWLSSTLLDIPRRSPMKERGDQVEYNDIVFVCFKT